MLVTPHNLNYALEYLRKCDELTVDTETTGLSPWTGDRVCGIAILGGNKSFYFPLRHVVDNLPIECLEYLQALLSDPNKIYVGYNYTFDMQQMLQDNIPLPKRIEEVKCAAHLLNENEDSFKLKELGDKYLGKGASLEKNILEDKLMANGFGKSEMWKLPPIDVAPYAEQDVCLTRDLRDFYVPHMRTWKVYDLWQEINVYQLAVTKMECRGILLDVNMIHQYIDEAQRNATLLEQKIRNMAGYPINVRSAKQLQKWLGVKSTAADVLEDLGHIEGVEELQEYRAWHRVKANYYSKFLQNMDSTNVLHANLNLIGTISGRLSCRNPPLQAIPTQGKNKALSKVKDVFIGRPGRVIVEADFSQAELRVASHYADERRMTEKLSRNADIHTETAEELKMPRDAAKRINFSVIYGIGAKKLSERLHIPLAQAKKYLTAYHRNYPGFKALYNRAERMASDRGYIRMYTGRLRHYNHIRAPTHKASSNLIQGSVGEMVRNVITNIDATLPEAEMFLQVHDSILFEVEESCARDVISEVKNIMLKQDWCKVPMKVDIKSGNSWGSAKKDQ